MKKKYLTISLALLGFFSNAQEVLNFESIQETKTISGAEQSSTINNKPKPTLKAIWDVQLLADITSNTGSVGQAGVAFYNNEFWTSLWSSDTLIRYSSAGVLIQKLQIPGVSSVRSITTDGVVLYMGNASTTISIVNPVTQLLVGTINTTNSVRFITYDSNLNGGAGGFWIGNFSSNIDAISMTGGILFSIPSSTHNLTGMYGAAIDNLSPGGPYLWVHNQGGINTDEFVGLQLPAGTPSVYVHDVFPDLVSIGITSSLAGGAFLSTDLVPGQLSLIGLTQSTGVNAIIAYELNILSNDVIATDLNSLSGYTKIPESQINGQTFNLSYATISAQTLDSVVADFDFYYNGSLVQQQTFSHLSVPTTTTGVFSSTAFIPSYGIGNYQVIATLRPEEDILDDDLSNNSLSFTFEITDSTYARDNGIKDESPYTLATPDTSYIGSNFEIVTTDTITGIWIELLMQNDGLTTYPFIYNFNASLPSTPVSIGELTAINNVTSTYYLRFNDTVILNPGIYTFGFFQESGVNINIAQSDNIYTPGTNFYYADGYWTQSGFETARFIRPIFGTLPVSNAGIDEENQFNIIVYPNPANDNIRIRLSGQMDATIRLINMSGSILLTQTVSAETKEVTIPIQHLSSGMYLVEILENDRITTKRVMIK
jgi:hypothetical protein